MNSGIYKLIFSSGRYYIGKTNNFERRWEEHFDKMRKGTAARNVQQEYDRYGLPGCYILFECHQDHIDLMEPYFIFGGTGPNMLNSVLPTPGTEGELNILLKNKLALECSTATICLALEEMHKENNDLRNEIEDLKDPESKVQKLQDQLDYHTDMCNKYWIENQKLKTRGFWDRLFNN